MKLELKHLAGYLGTNLKVKRTFNNEIMLLHGISGNHTIEALNANDLEMCALLAFGNCQIDDDEAFKPILRPLSDLTRRELELEGFDSYIDYLTYENKGSQWTLKAPFNMVQYLLSQHFDIYGLIENNLAIDKNTIL